MNFMYYLMAILHLMLGLFFLDISKAFDRVWHDRLTYKMKLLDITGPPLKLIQSFFNNRLQRVVLNCQNSSWTPVFAGVPQGSVLGPLFFLNILSTTTFFADDTSLFPVVNNINESTHQMNMDLEKISLWAYQWKMYFNPDISKQTQEVIFSKKSLKASHPVLYFNRTPVIRCSHQKHLGVYLDKKLSFHQHIKEIITKASKGIDVIKKLNNILPRKVLLTIYKSFVRPHLDYGDILYHQPYNEIINSKLGSIQYNDTLAITGTIKGTSRSKLYKGLGRESLKSRRTLRHLCAFHKLVSNRLPTYLFNLIPQSTHAYQNRTSSNIPTYQCRTDTFKHSFFPWAVVEWNKIHSDIGNASIAIFKKRLLKEIRLDPHPWSKTTN